VREVVANDAGGFVAFTLVRAVDRLAVGADAVATPAAACRTTLVHRFRLGGAAGESPTPDARMARRPRTASSSLP
jgi:hypothetical protein